MELPIRMLMPPEVILNKGSGPIAERFAPNAEIPRRIDMYFLSNKRSKGQYSNGWIPASPEDILAEKYEELSNPELSIFHTIEYPYYLHGICFKVYGSSTETMNRRRCIELRIDGENTVVKIEKRKLFVFDYHKDIRYELGSSFKSRILME